MTIMAAHTTKPSPGIPLTVAITTYNRLVWLREAVESVLNQTYRDFELLILDNHSTDGTGEYVLGLDDPRIRYVRNAQDSDAAFNAISVPMLARGARFVTLHDDDIMEPEMLSRQMSFMDKHPELYMVWVQHSRIDAHGIFISCPTATRAKDSVFAPGEYFRAFLDEQLWSFQSGVMYRRHWQGPLLRAYRRTFNRHYFRTFPIGESRANSSSANDILTPALYNCHHAIGFIASPLLRYRIHAQQDTRNIEFSRPLIFLYCVLKKLAQRIPGRPISDGCFDAHIARFKTQEILTMTQASLSKSKVGRIVKLWRTLSEENPLPADVCRTLLPVTLAVAAIDDKEIIPPEMIVPDRAGQIMPAPHRYFRDWALKRQAGVYILQGLENRRIVLFGSVFVAALLILEARKTGCQILACIDSNLKRHGRALLGIPIYSPDWLAGHAASIDTLILTPEKDHETIMTSVVRQWTDKPLDIISWKTLATEQLNPPGRVIA
jgi:glycosyltransferase involved in cell wall biosynthesis